MSMQHLEESYWGDLDIGEDIPPVKIKTSVINKSASSDLLGHIVQQQTTSIKESAATIDVKETLVKSTDRGQMRGAKVKEINLDMSSKALSEDIYNIRNKYIVGKIAGDNLYDQQGKLIVVKNEVITGEIVEWADREGKLYELIFNMTIPGLE